MMACSSHEPLALSGVSVMCDENATHLKAITDSDLAVSTELDSDENTLLSLQNSTDCTYDNEISATTITTITSDSGNRRTVPAATTASVSDDNNNGNSTVPIATSASINDNDSSRGNSIVPIATSANISDNDNNTVPVAISNTDSDNSTLAAASSANISDNDNSDNNTVPVAISNTDSDNSTLAAASSANTSDNDNSDNNTVPVAISNTDSDNSTLAAASSANTSGNSTVPVAISASVSDNDSSCNSTVPVTTSANISDDNSGNSTVSTATSASTNDESGGSSTIPAATSANISDNDNSDNNTAPTGTSAIINDNDRGGSSTVPVATSSNVSDNDGNRTVTSTSVSGNSTVCTSTSINNNNNSTVPVDTSARVNDDRTNINEAIASNKTETVILGDSVVRGLNENKMAVSTEKTQVISISGLDRAGLIQRLNGTEPNTKVKTVVVHVGINDCKRGRVLAKTAWRGVINSTKRCFPQATIFMSSVLPYNDNHHHYAVSISDTNSCLSDVCTSMKAHFIDHDTSYFTQTDELKTGLYKTNDAIHPNKTENFNVVIFSESTNSSGTKLGMLIDNHKTFQNISF
nr:hypothetical protein BaRGS_014354 [Batillaria attramentaria]